MAITKDSIFHEMKYINRKIEQKEAEIMALKEKLLMWQKCLNDLEEYENSSIEEKTLIKFISSDTATVDLMDEFESVTEEGFRKYVRLINRKRESCKFGWYCFIIERLGDREAIGDITMTKLKKGPSSDLIQYINSQIEKALNGQKIKEPEEILFDTPYLLRAQNSSNRTGYGSEYNGYDLIYQGTLYGETTEYAIVGVMFSKNISALYL